MKIYVYTYVSMQALGPVSTGGFNDGACLDLLGSSEIPTSKSRAMCRIESNVLRYMTISCFWA